jgi:hypothetical protein
MKQTRKILLISRARRAELGLASDPRLDSTTLLYRLGH